MGLGWIHKFRTQHIEVTVEARRMDGTIWVKNAGGRGLKTAREASISKRIVEEEETVEKTDVRMERRISSRIVPSGPTEERT